MMARPNGRRDEAVIKTAIDRFMRGDKLDDIAETAGVKQPTVSYWLRKHGLKLYGKGFRLRKQGRRKATQPNSRDKDIMKKLAAGMPTTVLADDYGLSRTRIAAICNTWIARDYKAEPLFRTDDVIKHRGRTFRVLAVTGATHGQVMDLGTKQKIELFHWWQDGVLAKRVE